jgi:RNA 2',3'-cyclic 3'-phosphodiesterase
MRAFVSVEVPDPRAPDPSTARSHLTLKFLGEVPDEVVNRLRPLVRAAVAPCAPFSVELRGVGAFPDPARPRVVWAGVGSGADELAELAKRVDEAVAIAGIPSETRPFTAHVTILRVRGTRDLDRARRWLTEGADRAFGRAEVREVVLNSSELRPEGAIHRALDRFPLAGSPGG